MSRRTLLVEGYTDTLLVKALLQKYGIQDVKPLPPRELGSSGNGVSNVISLLPSLLVQIKSQEFDSFGVLVDADFTGVNGGFIERKRAIESILYQEGYTELPPSAPDQFGSEYVCGGLIPIHLAILPNHSGDGMIENLLLQSVPSNHLLPILEHAKSTVAALVAKEFNPMLHTAKAELATYLAWSKNPGCDGGVAVKNNALDPNSVALSSLRHWFEKVFPQ
ncbi:MAG: DUF3226 domain-containing protein [Hydrogenophaga sp.]|nr:DUF3226 domain-containing protein [Hydrogenophaga sp.]